MDKKIDNFDMDETFESIFGEDSEVSDNTTVNNKDNKPTPVITSVKQVLANSVYHFNQNHLYVDLNKENFIQGYNFIINQNIPEPDKARKNIDIDDFSMLFAALSTTYWQSYISVLCGIQTLCENLVTLKAKLILCLKKIVARDTELYTDTELNSFFSYYLSKDAWHQKKLIAVKKFVKGNECSDEDFPYILFFISRRFIDRRFDEVFIHRLYIASLYCAYRSNKHFIYNEVNKFVIGKFLKYKKHYRHSSKNLTLALKSDSISEPSFFRNINAILNFLDLDSFVISRRRYYFDHEFEDKEKHPRTRFIKSEKSIIELLKWCLGKPHFKYGREISLHEQVIDDLYNVIQIPQNILRDYPAIVFLIYWSISFIKYNEFKSFFYEKTKPTAFSKTETKRRPYVKNSQYDNFTSNRFISINEGVAPILQLLLYFGILDLVPNEINLIDEFDKAMQESNWFDPKKQIDLLNKLLEYRSLPAITKKVDFRELDGNGFTKTESAVNLIYNIVSFNSINSELGIVQQVNHLDELRDRLFKYHKASWNDNDATDTKKEEYKGEFHLIQTIDCGFKLNNVSQRHLNFRGTDISRDFICKLFSETDSSCVPVTNDYKQYRHQYRSMLFSLYINLARNMFVHYAPFKPTLKLLEIRNFNDLLGIMYDVKSRLENESALYSIANKYEKFEFRHKGAFDIDGSKESLVIVLNAAFSSIIENEDAYIKQVASDKKDRINAFDALIRISKIEDPIFKPIHENIDKNFLSHKKHKKSVKKITQESFDILKSKQHEFIQWITRLLDEGHTTPSLRDAITSLECLYYCYAYTFIAGRSEPWSDEIKKTFWDLQRKIEAWISYFNWLIVKQDMKCVNESLKKLDYFENNFTNIIDLDRLEKFAKDKDYTHFENEIQKISKKIPSYLIFKDTYQTRNDFGLYEDLNYISTYDESPRYSWFRYDIEAIIKENEAQEMKKYLEFLEYEVLENETYYPDTPQFKKEFLVYLKNIDALIKEHFDDIELLSYARQISLMAQSKLADINKEIDVNSINVFKDDPTHNIHLLEITKKLLVRILCYITSMDDIEIRKKLKGEPLLDHNGNLTIKNKILSDTKKELEGKMYENPLYDDLQAYLNFIFGVSGHYQYHNGRECEKTILDLYGEQMFLYLIRVTFEMSQLKDKSKKAT
jgi:hypothetical protein